MSCNDALSLTQEAARACLTCGAPTPWREGRGRSDATFVCIGRVRDHRRRAGKHELSSMRLSVLEEREVRDEATGIVARCTHPCGCRGGCVDGFTGRGSGY